MFRNHKFNVLTFLIVFSLFSVAFYLYIGVVSPGGKTYSPFLDKYANVPAWLTYFICTVAKGLLQVTQYHVYQKTPNNVTIYGSRGVDIIWACLGYQVMSFWAAFIIAHRATWRYKIKWILIGIALITTINIIRIDLIALALFYRWEAFIAIEPHFAFTVVSYIAIAVLLLVFIKKYNRSRIEHEDAKEKLHHSTIVS